MKIYEYTSYSLLSGKIQVKSFEVKETEKCYIADGRRFSKEKMDKVYYDNLFQNCLVSLNNDKDTYKKLADYVINEIEKRINDYNKSLNNLKESIEDYKPI